MAKKPTYEELEQKVKDLEEEAAERKDAEEALIETQLRYGDVIESAHDLIQSVRPDGSFAFVNSAWLKTLGYDEEELPSLNLFDIIHPDSLQHCQEAFSKTMSGQRVTDIQGTFYAKDGREVYVEGSASPRFIEGEVIATHAIFRDLSERRLIQEALERRLSYEKMLGNISSRALLVDEIDEFLNSCLNIMGDTLDVSRIYIFEHHYETDTMDNTFEWAAPGINPQKDELQCIPSSAVTWLMDMMKNNQIINYRDIEDMPGEQEKEILRPQKIKSILLVPLFIEREYYGFMGFDESRFHREWTDEDIDILRTIAQIITGTLERKWAAEKEIRYVNDLASLSKGTTALVELSPEEDIYHVIGKHLKELIGDSIVFVSSFDSASESFCVRQALGLGEHMEAVLKLIGRHPVGMTIPISKEAKLGLTGGKLENVPGGLHDLSVGEVPKAICQAIEKLLGLGGAYAMGFAWGGELFGSTSFLMRRGAELKNECIIETFVRQASVALQRKQAEEELRKAHYALEQLVKERTARLAKTVEQLKQEIKGHKQSEEALKESEGKYRLLAEDLSDVVLTISRGGRLEYVSPAIKEFGGYDPEQEVGKQIARYFAKKSELIYTLKLIKKAIIDKKPASVEFLFKSKNKEPFYVEVTGKPIVKKNKVVNIQCVMRNITERKQAEEALKESEKRFRDISYSMADWIWEVDNNGRYTFTSGSIKEILGYDPEELIGKTPFDLMPEDEAKRIGEVFKRILSEKKPIVDLENWNLTKKGKEICLLTNGVPMFDENGVLIGYRGVDKDITEAKLAEKERKKLEAQLQQAQKMETIGILAGGVAHDLNNILSGIISYPELLLMDLPEDSPLRKPLLTIKSSGEKAAAVVQDLLTLARRGVVSTEIVNLNSIISEQLKSPEYEKLKSFHLNVDIKTNLEKDLLNIKGSTAHLSKTVFNLISNAAEAMPDGGKVLLSTENLYIDRPIRGYDQVAEGDYVVVTVSDTGIGISEEEIEKIFEPFYTKKVMGRSGSGLGMSVVWGTVKDHNGYIDIESTKGKGTTFTLYFPITRQELAIDKSHILIEDYMGKGESILIVDDVEEQREIAYVMLKKLGYSVKSVSSGEEAIEYMKDNSVDLLVLDMIMDPGIDGLDTYKKILELHPKQKAIIASGFSETDRVKEAKKLGAGAYVKKPYVLEKIGLVIKEELEIKGSNL